MSDRLTNDDLFDVLTDLEPVKAQWYNLGLGLKVRRSDLETIKVECRSSLDGLREMLEIWLDQVNPRPTWQQVVRVLRNPTIEKQSSLANKLEQKYCSASHSSAPPTAAKGRGDQVLTDADAYDISNYLLALTATEIFTLGLALGLDNRTMSPFKNSPLFLDEMITRWLQGKDHVTKREGHTWNALVKALRAPRVQQNEVATQIENDHCK